MTLDIKLIPRTGRCQCCGEPGEYSECPYWKAQDELDLLRAELEVEKDKDRGMQSRGWAILESRNTKLNAKVAELERQLNVCKSHLCPHGCICEICKEAGIYS